MPILAVVGAQYGSEGKGVVVSAIKDEYDIHVRVGGSNAGHSHIVDGKVFKQQVVPVGWANRNAELIIGRGGLVDLEVLEREIEEIHTVDPAIEERLYIDELAGVLDLSHKHTEGGVEGDLHRLIGSTGEGVGAARIARISRDPNRFRQAKDVPIKWFQELLMKNSNEYIMGADDRGRNILLEGTQGSGLSLIHGPWPFCTSNDTNAAQMAADIGLPPRRITQTALVARTYPIRVAGNSGPLKNELSWEEISARVGRNTVERTTVTKKIRRIGEWDNELFHRAMRLNEPSWVALMFMDYKFPAVEGATRWDGLNDMAKQYIVDFEAKWGVPVHIVGTGGSSWATIRLEQFAASVL